MGILKDDHCGNCDADLRGPEIPEESRHLYGGNTHFSRLVGVEYPYDHPQHYDGTSEWRCPDCGYREGRWSSRFLDEGESELRYGGATPRRPSPKRRPFQQAEGA